jgi:hypothetical protein
MKLHAVALIALVASSPVARAQPAPSPPAAGSSLEPAAPSGMKIVSGQAPVVGGNAVGARERALDEAIRQAVELTIADIADPATRAGQAKTVKALLARARSFVPRYRTLEEGEANGVYSVRLEAEVDEPAVRRKLEPAGSAAGPAPVRAAPPSVVVVAGDALAGSTAVAADLASALVAAGLKARVGNGAGAPPVGSGQAVARVTAAVASEGEARGTGRVSISCRGGAQLLTAPGAAALEDQATARAFVAAGAGAEPEAGRQDCLTRLSADLAGRIAARLGGSGGASPAAGTGGDLRLVTVDAEVSEPAAVPALVRGLRSVGAVSSAELTRIAAGRVEVRLRVRAATGAIAATLPRAAGSMITLSDVEVAGDVIRLRARLRAAAPAAGSNP